MLVKDLLAIIKWHISSNWSESQAKIVDADESHSAWCKKKFDPDVFDYTQREFAAGAGTTASSSQASGSSIVPAQPASATTPQKPSSPAVFVTPTIKKRRSLEPLG